MKEMDLMYAMTELDDELLERDSTAKVRRFRVSKVATIAAALALMTVTVFAAVVGINYWFGQDDDGYYTINFDFPLEPVTVNQEAYDDMAQELVNGLLYYQEGIEMGDYEEPNTQDWAYSESLDIQWLYFPIHDMGSLEEVEAYLGIDLNISPEIRAAVNGCFPVRSETHNPITLSVYGPRYEERVAEYETTGTITPHGIEIRMAMSDGGDNNWSNGFRVFIALTEEFAENFQPDPWYSAEDRGQYHTKDYSNGSQDFLIAKVDYTEEYGGICLAMYDDGGVGYYLHCETWPTDFTKNKLPDEWLRQLIGSDFNGEVCKDSEEIVLPLIENIE